MGVFRVTVWPTFTLTEFKCPYTWTFPWPSRMATTFPYPPYPVPLFPSPAYTTVPLIFAPIGVLAGVLISTPLWFSLPPPRGFFRFPCSDEIPYLPVLHPNRSPPFPLLLTFPRWPCQTRRSSWSLWYSLVSVLTYRISRPLSWLFLHRHLLLSNRLCFA